MRLLKSKSERAVKSRRSDDRVVREVFFTETAPFEHFKRKRKTFSIFFEIVPNKRRHNITTNIDYGSATLYTQLRFIKIYL